jgi:hypothetical protein
LISYRGWYTNIETVPVKAVMGSELNMDSKNLERAFIEQVNTILRMLMHVIEINLDQEVNICEEQ